jgi:pimeloyl-ACP methyl ester carboxylesterase
MTNGIIIILLVSICSAKSILAQEFTGPDTVSVNSGNLVLKALLWHPAGQRRFPTVLFGHGNYASTDTIHDPIRQASLLGPLFAARGYNYLVVFRRGVGLSKGQGLNSADLMEIAFKQKGQEGRNEIQLQ